MSDAKPQKHIRLKQENWDAIQEICKKKKASMNFIVENLIELGIKYQVILDNAQAQTEKAIKDAYSKPKTMNVYGIEFNPEKFNL